METLTYIVKMLSLDDVFQLVPVGDIHYGALGCDEEKFLSVIKRITEGKNFLTIGMGDYVENNGITGRNGSVNKHFDVEAVARGGQKGLVSEQRRWIRKIWEPIAPKTIGMLVGNHEDRTMSHDEFREMITEPLGVNYLGDSAYINLVFTYRYKIVNRYTILAQHSRFATHTHGNSINKASSALQSWDFDVHLFGHTHFALVDKFHRNYLDTISEKPRIAYKKAVVANTGAFLRANVEGVDSYTDKNLGNINRDVGTITITFEPKTGEFFGHV